MDPLAEIAIPEEFKQFAGLFFNENDEEPVPTVQQLIFRTVGCATAGRDIDALISFLDVLLDGCASDCGTRPHLAASEADVGHSSRRPSQDLHANQGRRAADPRRQAQLMLRALQAPSFRRQTGTSFFRPPIVGFACQRT